MKRRRKLPAWRCQGEAVLRDVAPGKVPVPLYNEDGSLWRTFDVPAHLVDRLEQVAKKKRWSFRRLIHTAFSEGIQRMIDEKERGF